MPNYICIGAPYYLGEARAERAEVEALRQSGIAAELGGRVADDRARFRQRR